VSAPRTCALLLRLYPPGWRARYGEELHALILETSDGRVSWRVRADVVVAAARERLRSAGLAGDGPPAERMRSGTLLVLCAWALFVVAGAGVQKFSEHWQAATPAGARGLPTAAFDVLLAAACVGSALVLTGVAAALPSLARFLRGGGLAQVRRPLLRAVALTIAALPVTVAVVLWAHRLSAAQRNGHDAAYAAVTVSWALLLAACLAAWTAAGVAAARRLALAPALVRLEALLAAGVAAAMVTMTAATAVWWGALARSAPSFLGAAGSPLAPQLLVATVLMLVATLAAGYGAGRAVAGLS
jgi:hypothetical protein